MMSVVDPKSKWQQLAGKRNWRNYILPRDTEEEFWNEGYLEATRLYFMLPRNGTVIDYGCGIGRVCLYLAADARRVIGLDICSAFIERANAEPHPDNVSFYQVGEYKGSEVADLVICYQVLQHNCEQLRKNIIDHIYKLMVPGGSAVIQFSSNKSRRYNETDFVHVFDVQEVIEYGEVFNSFSIINGCLVGWQQGHDPEKNDIFLIGKKEL